MLSNFLSLSQFKDLTFKNNAVLSAKPADKLSIYYYNDTHGNSDQMAGLLESAKAFKQKNQLNKDTVSFVLSAGDNVSGGNNDKNGFIYDLMQNMMGVDVSAIGNHEMDATPDGFYEEIKDKKMQFVATNVDFEDNHPLNNVVKKSIIKEQNGQKYGFIGTMPLDFALRTKEDSKKGLEIDDFDDTVENLQEEIDELKKQGVNKIILMSHSGYETDKKFAKALDGVDVIIGGHSHSVVDGAVNNENMVMSKSNEPVIITQAGENGKYYGILEAEFDSNGIIKKVGNKLFENVNTKKSPTVEYIKDKSLGESPVVAQIDKIDPMPKNRRNEPCAWTDLVADSMRSELKTDIAIVNAANTRKVPQEGKLTRRDIEESSPMKNKLLKTTITQKQLVDAIKQAAKETMSDKEGVPGLLHVSGVKYKIDKQGNLLEMSVLDKNGNYSPIDINNPSQDVKYSACYDDFVAKEQGGEYPLLAPKFAVENFDFDKDETLARHLSKLTNKDNLVVTDDKRIEIV